MALDLTYDLVNYTPADASPVGSNFNRIEQYVNQEIVSRDGSVAMTGQLKLVGDPVANTDAAAKQYVDAMLPIGIIMQYGGTATPPGGRWALCDGAVLATASYPALFAVIGYTFGGSGGSFSLPNLVDRVSVGALTSRGGATALGALGGSRDAAVVNHTHPIDHGHPTGTTATENVGHYHGVSINTGNPSADHVHSGTTQGMDRATTHHHAMYGNVSAATAGGSVTSVMNPFGTETSSTIDTNTDHLHNFVTGGISANHTHAVNGNTGTADTAHTHAFTAPVMAGPSGAASGGVAAANANMPPYVGVHNIMRVA